MIFLLTFVGFSAAGLLLLIHAMIFAPEGYEDPQGFHIVTPQGGGQRASDPHPLSTADLAFLNR